MYLWRVVRRSFIQFNLAGEGEYYSLAYQLNNDC